MTDPPNMRVGTLTSFELKLSKLPADNVPVGGRIPQEEWKAWWRSTRSYLDAAGLLVIALEVEDYKTTSAEYKEALKELQTRWGANETVTQARKVLKAALFPRIDECKPIHHLLQDVSESERIKSDGGVTLLKALMRHHKNSAAVGQGQLATTWIKVITQGSTQVVDGPSLNVWSGEMSKALSDVQDIDLSLAQVSSLSLAAKLAHLDDHSDSACDKTLANQGRSYIEAFTESGKIPEVAKIRLKVSDIIQAFDHNIEPQEAGAAINVNRLQADAKNPKHDSNDQVFCKWCGDFGCKSENLLSKRQECKAWNKPCHCGSRGHAPKVCKHPQKWPPGATITSKVATGGKGGAATGRGQGGPAINMMEQQQEADRHALDVATVEADLNSFKGEVLSALQSLSNKLDEKYKRRERVPSNQAPAHETHYQKHAQSPLHNALPFAHNKGGGNLLHGSKIRDNNSEGSSGGWDYSVQCSGRNHRFGRGEHEHS